MTLFFAMVVKVTKSRYLGRLKVLIHGDSVHTYSDSLISRALARRVLLLRDLSETTPTQRPYAAFQNDFETIAAADWS